MSSMEMLVHQLVRHGIQFHMLMPASHPIPLEILEQNCPPTSFQPLPAMRMQILEADDFQQYLNLCTEILQSPFGKPAFCMGGVVWCLAMDLDNDLYDMIDDILDGPMDMGSMWADYFEMNSLRYYDNIIPYQMVDMICGVHGSNSHKSLSFINLDFYLLFLKGHTSQLLVYGRPNNGRVRPNNMTT